MAQLYVCDRCKCQFTVKAGTTGRYGTDEDLCRDCGVNYQRALFRDRRSLAEKRADRERIERLDRAYR